jgi:cell wall-associated NlpC family hydrolase
LTIYATGRPLAHDSAQAIDAVKYDGGQRIYNESELQPGDLVYFGGSFEDFDHVGVYAGGGKMWDADIEFWIYPDGVHERTLKSVETQLGFVGGVRF